ncbi:MAG: tyrosine-type recombinase/integrase [Phycisphaerales bacterium]|nr:tyrosine-type recombinase/integrase [Phycisphaerales bacterium]
MHDLRRTHGTRMADLVPIDVLQERMGHSDVSVTARFYLGQADGHAESARAALQH